MSLISDWESAEWMQDLANRMDRMLWPAKYLGPSFEVSPGGTRHDTRLSLAVGASSIPGSIPDPTHWTSMSVEYPPEGILGWSYYNRICQSLLSTDSFAPNKIETIRFDDSGFQVKDPGLLGYKQLPSRSVVSLIVDAGRICPTHWKEIILRWKKLNDDCIFYLASGIAAGHFKSLKTLDLSVNPDVTDRSMGCLIRSLRSIDLEELHLVGTGLGETSLRGIAEALEVDLLGSVKKLDLSGNFRMPHKSLGSLFASLSVRGRHGIPLQDLLLRSCRLSDDAVIQLAKALASGNLRYLNKLDLSGNTALTDESMICVAAALAAGHTPYLKDFLWEWTAVGDEGVHEFARAISSGNLSYLERLKLTRNIKISDSSVTHLAESFGSEQGLFLKELSLSATGVTDDGVTQLASLVTSGYLISLEMLDFSACENVTNKFKEMSPNFFRTGRVNWQAELSWWLNRDDSINGVEDVPKASVEDVIEASSERRENQCLRLRSDIAKLGFTSWDQEYDSRRILLLCDQRKTTDECAEFLFFHVKGMAMFVGVGVAYSKVAVTRESFGYRVIIKEQTQESWKRYWSEALSRTGTFKPVLFKQETTLQTPSTTASATPLWKEFNLTENEALSKFGICMEGTNGQNFITISGVSSQSPEDVINSQPLCMKWFEDLVGHLHREDGIASAQHGLVSLALSNRLNETKSGYVAEEKWEEKSFLDKSDEQLLLRSHLPHLKQVGQSGEEVISGHSHHSAWLNHPDPVVAADEEIVLESSGAAGHSPGHHCHGSGEEGNVHGANSTLQQVQRGKRKQVMQKNSSHPTKQVKEGPAPTVLAEVQLKDAQKKALIIHIYFNSSNSGLYLLNNMTEEKEPMPSALPGVPPTRLPKSDIEPELVVGFLCDSAQSDGLNQLVTTLSAQYSIQSQKNDRPLGWSQDDLGLSFRSSKEEDAPRCVRMSQAILSPVKSKTLEFTRESGTAESTVMDKHFKGGFWSFEGGARAESTSTHSTSDHSASKVEHCCLSEHPTFAITATSKPRKLAYKAHSLIEPVARSDPLWRQMKGTGLYSTVRLAVEGKWNLLGLGLETYEFKVRKKLSKRSEGVENAVGFPDVTGTSITNGRGEGQSDEEFRLWQILRRRFILNHNFSQFLEARKRPNPYRWMLVDPSGSDCPVPEALCTTRE